MVTSNKVLFFVLATVLISFSSHAKNNVNSKEFGDYIVLFNTLPSNFLSPDIAKRYNLTRSRNRILLNIVVKKKTTGDKAKPVQAKVNAIATNLTGQLKKTTMRAIHDGTGIYYLGEFSVANAERLNFKVDVTPKAGNKTYVVTFKKKFMIK